MKTNLFLAHPKKGLEIDACDGQVSTFDCVEAKHERDRRATHAARSWQIQLDRLTAIALAALLLLFSCSRDVTKVAKRDLLRAK